MKFEIDDDIWKILLKDKEEMLKKLNENRPEDDLYTYGFGACLYPEHEIWINKESCIDQQVRTLRHELTHCWIWYSGLYNAPHYTEEMVCDMVANSYNFINNIVNKFKEEQNSIK